MSEFPSERSYVLTKRDYPKKFIQNITFVKQPDLDYSLDVDGPLCKPCPYDRIILGGGMVLCKHGNHNAARDYIRVLHWAHSSGKIAKIHNVGVGGENIFTGGWYNDSIQEFLETVDFSVRDPLGRELVKIRWPLARLKQPVTHDVTLTHFPESFSLINYNIAKRLLDPARKYLGVSLVHSGGHIAEVKDNRERVEQLLARYPDHVVVPIVSTMHTDFLAGITTDAGNDAVAFRLFQEDFLSGREVAGKEMLDPVFWCRHMSPYKLKGVISSCDALISQRKHNCINAIQAQVPTIFLGSSVNDSVTRTWNAVKHKAHPDSELVEL